MARASRLRASRYGAQAALLAVIAAAACPHAAVENNTLTAINGITVGHYTLAERPTGCTVILFDGHTVAGISQRGSAPGTPDTDLLQPTNAADRVDAVVLSGGSAFGLDAASGAMRWLDEHNSGSLSGRSGQSGG